MKVEFEYAYQVGMAGELFAIADLLFIKGKQWEIYRYIIEVE